MAAMFDVEVTATQKPRAHAGYAASYSPNDSLLSVKVRALTAREAVLDVVWAFGEDAGIDLDQMVAVRCLANNRLTFWRWDEDDSRFVNETDESY